MQRLSRDSVYKKSSLRWFFAHKRMRKYFELSFSDENCGHDTCTCALTVKGIHETTCCFSTTSTAIGITKKVREVSLQIQSTFAISPEGVPFVASADMESEYIKQNLIKGNSMVPTEIPHKTHGGWPESRDNYGIAPETHDALLESDVRQLKDVFGSQFVERTDLEDNVWRDAPSYPTVEYDHKYVDDRGGVFSEKRWKELVDDPLESDVLGSAYPIPALKHMILKKYSSFHQAVGLTNGRQHVVAAMSNMYDRKLADAVVLMNQKTQVPPAPFEELKPLIGPAMDLWYYKMKITEFGKHKSTISFDPLRDVFHGASSGLNFGPSYVVSSPDMENDIIVSPNGKKIDVLEADVAAIMDLLRDGKEPPVYYNVTPKNENFFDWVKQLNDEDYATWKGKLRLFVIPSSVYLVGERLVSNLRQLIERGWGILVGHSHSFGGTDKLAKMLGVTLDNCWLPIIEEGDAKKFDQTVLEFFTNLYFSTMLIHEDKTSPDYEAKVRLTKWLLKNMITRLTRAFSDYWVWQRGGVPSGCLNTSHMDSWIMGMYFMLFGVHTVATAPAEDQEEMERLLYDYIALVVYGDDHLWNRGNHRLSSYFSAYNFAAFCAKYLGVTVRDIHSGQPFCSKTQDGWITSRGAVMLKHSFVVNPCKREGQSTFLPFRESREFMIRAVWGRETKPRDGIDVLLSVIGHAYGTYASNPDAYRRLLYFYEELVKRMKIPYSQLLRTVQKRVTRNDMKKLRQLGTSTDDILRGFPSWTTLENKNITNWEYHDRIIYQDEGTDLDAYME